MSEDKNLINKKLIKVSKEIVQIVNKSSNDYDAVDEIIDFLKKSMIDKIINIKRGV